MPDVYPMRSHYHLVDPFENNIINDSIQIEIPKQDMDVPRTCTISNWTSEPYYQNLNLIEWKYRTIKLWTKNVMNESDVSSNYWLLCIIYVCYLLNHIVYSNNPQIPDHSLTTDGGECRSPTGTSKGSQSKILSKIVPNGFFRSR